MGPASGWPDDRLCGEPGIHKHWPRAMDSRLATFGGAQECCPARMIGFAESVY